MNAPQRIPCLKCGSKDTWFENTISPFVSSERSEKPRTKIFRCRRCGIFKLVDFEAFVDEFLQRQRDKQTEDVRAQEAERRAEEARLVKEAEKLQRLREEEEQRNTLCSCPGCEKPRSGVSKYCSEYCRKRTSYLKKKAARFE